MFLRTIVNRVIPSSLRVLKVAAWNSKESVQKLASSRHAPSTYIPNVCLHRQYSQEANTEAMIANYDYVKRATSNKNILIVDVREPDEIKEHGKIPNSVNIPLGSVSSVLSSMTDSEFEKTFKRPKPLDDTEIIFYCMIGKRSGMAQENALKLGYQNVKNYLGSWTEWATKSQ